MYMRLAGLLTRFHPSPSHWSAPTVALMMDAFVKLTATGIVPDLHRASLFIPSQETNSEQN
jgi:hypothetical protein